MEAETTDQYAYWYRQFLEHMLYGTDDYYQIGADETLTRIYPNLTEDERLERVATLRMATDSGRRHDLDDVIAELGIDGED